MQKPASSKHMFNYFSIDATRETRFYGRLLNHSCKKPNCETELLTINHAPVLIIKAARDIQPGEIHYFLSILI